MLERTTPLRFDTNLLSILCHSVASITRSKLICATMECRVGSDIIYSFPSEPLLGFYSPMVIEPTVSELKLELGYQALQVDGTNQLF